jgi:hypothetical protein
MLTYPTNVLGEFDTLAAVVGGRSIARYGDGEFKIAAHGADIKSQVSHPMLSKRLRDILQASGECLVGIPNIKECVEKNPNLDKVEFWLKQRRFHTLLASRQYVSSFITRPDSAPWIDTDDYWDLLESMWRGQDVTLVRGSGKSFTGERLMEAGARSVREIQAPRQHAWAEYDSLMRKIGTPKRALLCLGPTATVMAVDLCAKGVHAIDLGHLGMFHKKRVAGDPMWVTDEDKAVDRVPA